MLGGHLWPGTERRGARCRTRRNLLGRESFRLPITVAVTWPPEAECGLRFAFSSGMQLSPPGGFSPGGAGDSDWARGGTPWGPWWKISQNHLKWEHSHVNGWLRCPGTHKVGREVGAASRVHRGPHPRLLPLLLSWAADSGQPGTARPPPSGSCIPPGWASTVHPPACAGHHHPGVGRGIHSSPVPLPPPHQLHSTEP